MTPHSSVRLPLAGGLTVVGLVAAVALGRPDLALLSAPWAVVLVLGVTSIGAGPPRIRVAVDQSRVVSGDEVEVVVTVESSTMATVTAEPVMPAGFDLVGDDPPAGDHPDLEAHRGRAGVVGPGQPATLRCLVRAGQWGNHDLGRVVVRVRHWYGLVEWAGMTTSPRLVRVHPRPRELRQLVAPRLVRGHTGAHLSGARGRGVEYADLRPFATGDSQRDISWPATARTGELWVADRHPERATEVVLLLDSFVESGHDVKAVVGMAIEAALAVAESHLARTDRIGLVELGGVVRWVTPGTGSHQLQRLTDALLDTGLYANAADRDLSMVPPRALPPRSLVVALSPLLDERFLAVLHELRRGGHDVAVIECVPGPGPRPTTTAGRLAARLWAAEQAMVRDQLVAHRIVVGRWFPGQDLAPVLATMGQWRAQARRAAL